MEGSRARAVERPRGPERAAVGVGLLAAVAFPIVVLWDGATRGQGYDASRHWISLLSLGERALLGRVSLAVAGVAFVVGGVGMARLGPTSAGRPAARSRTGRWIAAMGVGLMVAAAFPIDAATSYPIGSGRVPLTPVGAVHALAGTSIVVTAVAACRAGIGMVGSPGARRAARAVWAWVLVTASLGGILGVVRAGNWELARAGLFQRTTLFTAMGWIAALAAVALWSDGDARESDRPVWAGPIRRGELQRFARR